MTAITLTTAIIFTIVTFTCCMHAKMCSAMQTFQISITESVTLNLQLHLPYKIKPSTSWR